LVLAIFYGNCQSEYRTLALIPLLVQTTTITTKNTKQSQTRISRFTWLSQCEVRL
jgi:hypothetical protein